MPTITHEPIGIAAEGTTGDLAFSDDHLIELAELSGYETTNIILPLQQAAAAIGRFRYTLDASTMPAVQRAAIAQTRGLAVGLLTNLRGRNDAGHPQGLDEQSKALLQLAYAGACGKTPEQARSTFEEFDDSEVVAR